MLGPSVSRGFEGMRASKSSAGGVTADPPLLDEHHVRVPDGVARVLRALPAHARGTNGGGIRIAMIDSGFFPHPFFTQRGYRITRVPTRREPQPEVDDYGHGTAQLSNLFAIAP